VGAKQFVKRKSKNIEDRQEENSRCGHFRVVKANNWMKDCVPRDGDPFPLEWSIVWVGFLNKICVETLPCNDIS